MKTNSTFYNAVDWVKTHGWDFWEQFDEDVWNAAGYYVQETSYPDPRGKREVLEEIRKYNEFFHDKDTGEYGYKE